MTSTKPQIPGEEPTGGPKPPGKAPSESDNKPAVSVNGPGTGEYIDAMAAEATALMTRARSGDPHAFDDLTRRLRGRAFHVAHSLVGSREDALDLCQETFLKVFRARGSYDPAQPFLPWFHRILRNTCFSFLRKKRRVRSLSAARPEDGESDFEIEDPTPGPTSGIELDERADMFRTALETLGANDREILALRHFKDLSYREIAEHLGIPEGTVMSRLYHARRRLRETLGPKLGEVAQDTQTNSKRGKSIAPGGTA
jgi:RNA polymerase sigma-70 factor, ECF subfamily